MSQRIKKDGEPPVSAAVEQLLRLALAPPDEDLLRRYFAEKAGPARPPGAPLTPAERKWVAVNLGANPRWQEQWRLLEAASGLAVDPGAPAFIPRPGAPNGLRLLVKTPVRMAVAASLVLLALYGMLWWAGRATLPETYALASVSGYEEVLGRGVRLESPAAPGDFARGAEALLQARRSTLGLFPHYDQAQAARAAAHLQRALEDTSDPFQRAEIAFFLAKARLMQEDAAAAREALQELLNQNVSDYRQEAQALLRRLSSSTE